MKKIIFLFAFIFCIGLSFNTYAQAPDPIIVKGCGVQGGGWLSGAYQITCPNCYQYIDNLHSCDGITIVPGNCPSCIIIQPAPYPGSTFTLTLVSTGQWWTISSWTTVINDDGSSTTTFVIVDP